MLLNGCDGQQIYCDIYGNSEGNRTVALHHGRVIGSTVHFNQAA